MTAKIENSNLIVEIPIVKSVSKSGKSIVIASSHGNVPTTATFDGKPVTIGLNAYVKA